jgi:uncharacterized protein YcfL
MKKLLLSVALVASLVAQDEVKTEDKGVIDTAHENVVETLDENVEVLPEELQGTAKELVGDIEKDGKNVHVTAKFSHIGFDNYADGTFGAWMETTQLATIGVLLLPNTWKINLSYTGELGKDLILASDASSEWEEEIDNYTGSYIVYDSEVATSYLNFYMQPLNFSFGNFGFGYTSIEKSVFMSGEDGKNIKVLDIKDSSLDQAATFSANNFYARRTETTQRYLIAYTIPYTDSWYDGFGLSVAQNNSNRAFVIEAEKSMVIKPDVKSSIITIGFNKTLDEINSGISIKKLTFGSADNEVSYYDYDQKSNQTLTSTSGVMDVEIVFMNRLESGKKIYFAAGVFNLTDENQHYSEATLELGMVF